MLKDVQNRVKRLQSDVTLTESLTEHAHWLRQLISVCQLSCVFVCSWWLNCFEQERFVHRRRLPLGNDGDCPRRKTPHRAPPYEELDPAIQFFSLFNCEFGLIIDVIDVMICSLQSCSKRTIPSVPYLYLLNFVIPQQCFRTYYKHREVHHRPDKLWQHHGILQGRFGPRRWSPDIASWRVFGHFSPEKHCDEFISWYIDGFTQNKKLVTCQFCYQKLQNWFALHWQSWSQLVLPNNRSRPFVDWKRTYDPPCRSIPEVKPMSRVHCTHVTDDRHRRICHAI